MSKIKPQVLVIGGAGCLGQTLVPKLISRGYEVFAADIKKPDFFVQEYFELDATCPENFENLCSRLQREGINISHVVNSVGTLVETGLTSIFETSAEEINRSLDLNLKTQINALRYLGEHVISTPAENKSFTLISSINAHHGYSIPVYSAAKSGLHGLIRPIAMEFGAHGVRVNIVTPGSVLTSETQKQPKNFELRAAAAALKRLATCQEVADGITACMELTGMTGSEIVIDAGQSINPSESLYDQIRLKPAASSFLPAPATPRMS